MRTGLRVERSGNGLFGNGRWRLEGPLFFGIREVGNAFEEMVTLKRRILRSDPSTVDAP